MKVTYLIPSALAVLAAASGFAAPANEPAPYGAVPTARQLAWHDLETYAFLHFTTNTFTDREWGNGDEDEKIFNPTDFDADQIVGTLAKAGFKGVILTCKHHDGFCLWPTKTTTHNVSASPWKNGKGDVVREISEAAKRHHVGFGVYLSPWDRNNAGYGKPAYVKTYLEQLRELLTNYGPIFEVWHDGANGGSGYYGGARESRSIDRTTYYNWPEKWDLIRKLQPGAVVFSDVGPDLRWVGNEGGHAPYPNWAAFSPVGPDGGAAAPGHCRTQNGSQDGKTWIPAETDVSIRPGWFWHAQENNRVRSPKNLLDLYFSSVGHGTSFLLNVPPDRRGRIHENDVASLEGFKAALDKMFAHNLADGAKATSATVRGPAFAPANLFDHDKKSYWTTPDGITTATIEAALPETRTFSVLGLREEIRLGQRIRKFAVDVRENGAWREWIGNGTTVGPHTYLRGQTVTADGVRLRILDSAPCPCLSELSLWLEPTDVSNTSTPRDPSLLANDGWKVTASFETKDHPAAHAVDGDPGTIWCTHDSVKGEQGPPQWIAIDLGHEVAIDALVVLPRQDGTPHAIVDRYQVEWSADGKTWSKPLAGEFANIRANPIAQDVKLPAGTKARHVRFTALHVIERNNVTIAEIGIRVAK